MIGAILGDIIGSRFEFNEIKKRKSEDFELFTKDCKFTDDTVMTIATADAIMNKKSYAQAYYEWGNKYPKAGYAGYFKRWLASKDPKPYGSFGNGSAMRVSPVAWLFNDWADVKGQAFLSAACTHNHEEGLKGALAVAGAIYGAKNYNMDEAAKKALIISIIEDIFEYNMNFTIEQIRPTYKFEVTCQKSVPEAIMCFYEGKNYEEAVRKAISLGGDTDTQACIAGNIAEAMYGIPKEIYDKVYEYLPLDMLAIVEQFEMMKG